MKRNFSKRFLALILCLTLFLSMSISASAVTLDSITDCTVVLDDGSEITPLAEETEWIFRINNGYYEKRLWSYTYGKWLTDWIVLNPVE